MASKKRLEKDATSAGGETLGSRLAQIRATNGYSQAGLARETCIAQNLISDWETGKRRINVDALATLAMKFHVSADELLGITPLRHRNAVPPRRRILRRVERIYDLPQATQDLVLRSLELMIEGGAGRIPVRGQPLAKRSSKKKI